MDRLAEVYAYELGWKSVRERFTVLASEHGLDLDIQESDLQSIDEAEQVRHVLVHNSGRVSSEYLRRTHRRDLVIGDDIPMSREYAAGVSILSALLCGDLYMGVSEKFFGVDPEHFGPVMRRGRRPERLAHE